MPRAESSIDALLEAAVGEAVAKVAPRVAQAIAEVAARELETLLAITGSSRRARPSRRRAGEDLTKWVADRRARRVPNFVIEMTSGLDTKKKIVAKFGNGAVFEKGKPLPKLKNDSAKAEAKKSA